MLRFTDRLSGNLKEALFSGAVLHQDETGLCDGDK